MKKLVSIILVCIMVVALLPASVFAANNVKTISSAEEFAAIKDDLGGSYKLTKDITITEAISYRDESKLFTGTLDGDGHTITVDLKDTNEARFAIFCSAGSCTIKNLTVKGTIESNGNSTGTLLGTVKDNATVTIENVTTNVKVTSGGNNGTGGMIGCVENGGANVTIKNSTNKGAVTGTENAGGFIGKVQDNSTVTFEGCVNEGAVESTNQYADYRGAGGFIGVAQNRDSHITFKSSENKGAVTAKYIAASASIGHNNVNTENLDYSGLKNSGTITSGGYKLPADMATAKAVGIWGDAAFSYDFETGALTGNPRFHAMPELDGFTAYVNGTKATDKATLTATGEDRQVAFSVNTKDIKSVDGFASVTVIFKDGSYATFGCPAPTAAEADIVNSSADKLSKHEQIELTYDKSENGFKADGWENDHGSEGKLFGGYKDSVTDTNGKYEGWKQAGKSVKIYFTTAEEVRVGYYALGTGGDDARFPDRQFTEWKLWASADGETYVELDHQSNYDMPNINNRLVAFSVDSETAYKFYMVELIKCESEEGKNEGDWCYVQLGEIALFEACDHEWSEPVVKDATCTKNGSSTKTCAKCGEEEVTVIKATGHNFEDGVCTVCGTKEGNVTPAPTGDASVTLVVISLLALLGTGLVVTRRRSVR